MEKFIIEGGTPLSGSVVPAGNKNAALPALAASLLTDQEVVLRNVPRIRDVEAMIELLVRLGVKAEWREENVVSLRADEVTSTAVDPELAERIRASFLRRRAAARALRPRRHAAARRRRDRPPPARPALRRLPRPGRRGASWSARSTCPRPTGLHACDFFMDEPSVMATENALMAAALAPGSTVIHNAAAEPHVQDLARLLMQMGARIEGIGSNLMIVHGQEELGGADYAIGPDYIEVGSFIALAACTGGELRIRDVVPDDLRMTRLCFERLGCVIEVDGNDVIVPPDQQLRIKSDEGDAVSKIEDGPWPAFPADLTSIALAHGHSGGRARADPREDVREPPVLRRQARLHGRSGDRLRPPQGGRQRPEPASRRAHGEPGHPGRHGHAHRGAVRGRAARRSATSARSTAATSASTSGCGRWARGSSAWPQSASPSRAARRPR